MKTKLLMAAALIMAAACNQKIQTVEEEKVGNENDRVTVTVNVRGGVSTRATGIDENNEKAVSDIQLFVFDSKGKIDSYAKGESPTFQVKVSTGTKDFVALVNCPDLGDKGTKEELMSTVSYLKNNGLDHFEMVGELAGKTITADDAAAPALELTVKRIVSKVVIKKISTAFTSPYLDSLDFKVTGIYLTNAVASNSYAVDKKEFDWVNKNGKETENPAEALTYDVVNQQITIKTPYEVEHAFYCYPNSTETDSAEKDWSPRYTRLIIETTLGEKVGYYSVKIPNIERNKVYTVSELVVTRRGSENPWEDITTANAQFTIKVADWDTETDLGTVTI